MEFGNWFELHCELGSIRHELEDKWDSPARWALIRKFYRTVEPFILNGARMDPYMLGAKMTHIEQDVWHEIRLYGLPFYPQYPVGRRFVDFGDPCMSLAIEVDGAAYHTPEGDAQKDRDLAAEGWRVLRIKGKDAYSRNDNLESILGLYGKCMHKEVCEE